MTPKFRGIFKKFQAKADASPAPTQAPNTDDPKTSDPERVPSTDEPDPGLDQSDDEDVFNEVSKQRASEEETGPIYFTKKMGNNRDPLTMLHVRSAEKKDVLRNDIRMLLQPEDVTQPAAQPSERLAENHKRPSEVKDEYDLSAIPNGNGDPDPLNMFEENPDTVSTLELPTDDDPLGNWADILLKETLEQEQKRDQAERPAETQPQQLAKPDADPLAWRELRRAPEPSAMDSGSDTAASEEVPGDAFIHQLRDPLRLASEESHFQTTQTKIAKQLDILNSQCGLHGCMLYVRDGLLISIGEIPASGDLAAFAMKTLQSLKEKGTLFRIGVVRSLDLTDLNNNHVVIQALDAQSDKAILLMWSGTKPVDPGKVQKLTHSIMPIVDQWLAKHGD